MKTDFKQALERTFNVMEKCLPKNLYYHGIHHTRDDVLPAAIRLGHWEGISKDDMTTLATAALYHDTGYMLQYPKNEPIGVQIAQQSLPKFGYNDKQIQRISEIIMATQLKNVDGKFIQVPDESDLLQKIICDADLDSLGRKDFFVISHNLKRELEEYGMPNTLRQWYEKQLVFLQSHSYFTESAQMLRNEVKMQNMEEIRELLSLQQGLQA